jgi:hypothetical protein
MPNLTLDEETHTYELYGRRLISVTQALSLVDDRRGIDPWYMERGRLIHLAAEYLDLGVLDDDTIDPQIEGYLRAYKKFLDDTHFTIVDVERKLYHPTHLYAGKIDRIGTLNGDGDIIDLKSGTPARVDELQLAAYFELCRVNDIPVKKAFDLYLHQDGIYKLEPIPNPKLLLPTFLNVLGAYRWKIGG